MFLIIRFLVSSLTILSLSFPVWADTFVIKVQKKTVQPPSKSRLPPGIIPRSSEKRTAVVIHNGQTCTFVATRGKWTKFNLGQYGGLQLIGNEIISSRPLWDGPDLCQVVTIYQWRGNYFQALRYTETDNPYRSGNDPKLLIEVMSRQTTFDRAFKLAERVWQALRQGNLKSIKSLGPFYPKSPGVDHTSLRAAGPPPRDLTTLDVTRTSITGRAWTFFVPQPGKAKSWIIRVIQGRDHKLYLEAVKFGFWG